MEKPRVRRSLFFVVAGIIVVSVGFGVVVTQIGAMGSSAEDARVLVAEELRAAIEARAIPVVDVRFTSNVDSQVAEAYEVVLSSSGSPGHSGIDDAANTMEVMREASLLKGRGVNLEAVAIRMVDSSGVVVTALDTVVLPQTLDETLSSDRVAALKEAIAAGVRAQEKDVGVIESVIDLTQDPDGSRRSHVVYRLAKLDDYNQVVDGERYLDKALAGVIGAAKDLNETVHVITVDLTGEKGESLARLRVDYDAAANEVDRAVHFAPGYWPKEWRLHSGVAN